MKFRFLLELGVFLMSSSHLYLSASLLSLLLPGFLRLSVASITDHLFGHRPVV